MEQICWTDSCRNEEVGQTVEKEGTIINTVKRRKANWTVHNLRMACLVHVIEGKIVSKIEMTGRPGRRRMQISHDLMEKERTRKIERGSTRWHYVENSFRAGYGRFVRWTAWL